MISRRTRARLAFLGNLLALPFRLYQLRHTTNDEGTSVTLDRRWLSVGCGIEIAVLWAYDHDVGLLEDEAPDTQSRIINRSVCPTCWEALYTAIAEDGATPIECPPLTLASADGDDSSSR
jgi:hypothetical protein